jgi:UDPglucose 6-dehydrogenase
MSKLEKHLDSLIHKRVALLGLAFKPDTDDMRGASSLVLAARLQGESASVVAYDPVAEPAAAPLMPGVEMAGSALDALDGADAAVLVTEWPEFAELDWAEVAKRMANPLLVDGRNFLDPKTMHDAGITYESIGRPGAADRSAVG